jgi:dihydroorotase
MDLVVEGRAFVRGRLLECEVGIAEGRIARVRKALAPSERAGARALRVGRGAVLPGAVDAHVHLREPGLEHKETVRTGTLAALHGGVTTVLEMPNTVPPVASPHALEDKASRFAAHSLVDWGLHAMVDADLRAFELGARPVGYKLHLGPTTHAGAFPLMSLRAAMERAARAGRPLAVHAEHPRLVREAEGPGWESHGKARPPEAEWRAVEALAAAAPARARVLVAHCSTVRGLQAARRAGFRAEVAPHHLLLDQAALRDQGARAKVNPPLRGPKERAALWKAFASGKAHALASDHAPHTAEEKAQGLDKAPSGMPGVETMLPLMLAKVRARSLGLGVLLRAACEGPADLFGLPKGRIEEGRDADLLLVDLSRAEPVRAAALHSKCGWTCFEGHKAVFPSAVLLRGEEALAEGRAAGLRGQPAWPRGEAAAGPRRRTTSAAGKPSSSP